MTPFQVICMFPIFKIRTAASFSRNFNFHVNNKKIFGSIYV